MTQNRSESNEKYMGSANERFGATFPRWRFRSGGAAGPASRRVRRRPLRRRPVNRSPRGTAARLPDSLRPGTRRSPAGAARSLRPRRLRRHPSVARHQTPRRARRRRRRRRRTSAHSSARGTMPAACVRAASRSACASESRQPAARTCGATGPPDLSRPRPGRWPGLFWRQDSAGGAPRGCHGPTSRPGIRRTVCARRRLEQDESSKTNHSSEISQSSEINQCNEIDQSGEFNQSGE